jgi:leucyl/phenylalanyl-tRNA--protein transferase
MPTPRAILQFPDPRNAPADGLLAVGGNLHLESLLTAYRQGIFPWPQGSPEEIPLLWFSPDPRGVLFFKDLHIPASLKRFEKAAFQTKGWTIATNTQFEEVMKSCAEAKRPGQRGTWITEEMIQGYLALHRAGYAHSLEVLEKGKLVGGLYGVAVDGAFAAESMFYREPNASKVALLALCRTLASQGVEWIDIQMVTPTLAQFGAREIPRDTYLSLLERSRKKGLALRLPATLGMAHHPQPHSQQNDEDA